jgi:hypothetical protein
MSNKYLEFLVKEAGMLGTLAGAAKSFAGAVKSDAGKLPAQFKAAKSGLSPRVSFAHSFTGPVQPGSTIAKRQAMAPSAAIKAKGIKDLVKNKALVTGAAGVAGAAALMTPRKPADPYK